MEQDQDCAVSTPERKKQQQEVISPQKPKRGKSSFMHFCDERRPALLEASRQRNDGKVKMAEVGKELALLWSQVSPEEKGKYEAFAAEDKAKFDAAMKEFTESRVIEGFMKKPTSAYFQFVCANRAIIAEEYQLSGAPAVGKKASELWGSMTADEKRQYEEKYTAEKQAYDAWKGTVEGKTALGRWKAQKQEAKDAAQEKAFKKQERLDRKAGVKRARPDGGKPKMGCEKRSRRIGSAPSQGEGSEAPVAVRAVLELPDAIVQLCEKMGNMHGVPAKIVLGRLLLTEGIGEVPYDVALAVLEKHGGLLNKARGELLEAAARAQALEEAEAQAAAKAAAETATQAAAEPATKETIVKRAASAA